MFRFLVLVSLLVMSTGCSTLPAKQNGWQDSNASVSGASEFDVIGQTPVGAIVMLENNQYQVINEYTAASGRDCRSLIEQRSATERVACLSDDSHWYLRPALTPSKSAALPPAQLPISESANPVAKSQIDASDVVVEVAQPSAAELNNLDVVAVATNENLWRFAKRVTGNALNWQAIAEVNGISNVNSLRVGQKLRIPAQLQVLARAKPQTLAAGG